MLFSLLPALTVVSSVSHTLSSSNTCHSESFWRAEMSSRIAKKPVLVLDVTVESLRFRRRYLRPSSWTSNCRLTRAPPASTRASTVDWAVISLSPSRDCETVMCWRLLMTLVALANCWTLTNICSPKTQKIIGKSIERGHEVRNRSVGSDLVGCGCAVV